MARKKTQGKWRWKNPKPLAIRFADKVRRDIGDVDSCWIWTGSKNALGYGRVFVDSMQTPKKAHRVAWELEHGPIPEGACVLHRCDNPPCVRPSHLFLGTMQDNTDDARRKGRLNPGGYKTRKREIEAAELLPTEARA